MSSRQLRKLQQQRELEQARLQAEAQEAEEESEDEPVISVPKSKPSLFANLAALEDKVEDEDEAEEKAVESQHELSQPEPSPAPASKAKKSKKKKKAKNKAKDKSVEENHENGVDDIDAALRELNIKQASKPAAPLPALDPEYERVDRLLSISSQHLKVANEMRNLFGRTAVDNHDEAGGPVGRGTRRRQRAQNQQVDLETALKGHHAPGKGLPELILRRNYFIQGKEEWPKGTTGGLTMAMVKEPFEDGVPEFRYVHDQNYQTLQQSFQHFVNMGDPQNLIGLLVRNPYHISLLIQVSKIAKDQGDHALSSDLLERALFTFGRAATSTFNTKLSQGKVHVSFARPENRELWLAGYHYIKSLVMKGTYSTGLEWAKLLLALKPYEDPYAMRLMIHHLALRAHDFKWLLELYGDSKWAKHWENTTNKGQNPAIYHVSPSLAFAAMQLREGAKCRKLLSDSMNKVPWLFFRLFKELDLDAPPSIWGIEPRTDAETLFTEIYVLQTKDLWNTPEATALLMEVAHTIPKVDVAKIPTVNNSEMSLDVVRFVYLENIPAVMALAPSNLLHRSNNSDSDPLPPDENIFSYNAQRAALQDSSGMGGDFNNPFAAIGNFLPPLFRDIMQLRRVQGEHENELPDRVQREIRDLQDMIEDEGSDGEGQPPRGLLERLLTGMFGGGRGDEDYESEEEYGTDTDDEMPALTLNDVDREVGDWGGIDEPSEGHEGEEESDHEMPALE